MTPINTLYINNINDRVSLKKLQASLRDLFSQYGNIIQITAHKNLKMKGQAFITFDNLDSSINAQKKLNNHSLFKKPMRVTFAATNSDNYYHEVEKDDTAVVKRKNEKESASRKHRIDPQPKPAKKRKVKDFKQVPPNKVLLLQNTQDGLTEQTLENDFKEFEGFLRVRMVAVRHLAFIDFESEEFAGRALHRMSSHYEGSILSYAKK